MKNCEVTLITENNKEILFLSEKYNFEEKENFFVYHFKLYECEVKIKYDENIERIVLNIAGIEYELDNYTIEETFLIFKVPKVRCFQCIWGYTIVTVKIYTHSDENYYFYSKLINVVLDYKIEESLKIETSIKEMIRFIIDNNINFSSSVLEQKFSINTTNFLNSDFKTLYNELNQLEQIVNSYLKNKSYFLNDLKYKLCTEYKIDDFEKIKTIDSHILKFLIQNPQYYKQISSSKGIFNNKWHYSPTKVLIDSKEFDYNILENKIILGFLKSILLYIDYRIILVKEILGKNKKDKYYTLQNIINFYYEFYYEQLLNIKPIIESLYFHYKKIMKCKEEKIENIPKFSFIFKNYHHYRDIYIVIYNWLQNKSYDLNQENTLNNLITIDKIYEYYSLGKLIKGFFSLGYVNVENYYYEYSNNIFLSHKEINTFVFIKNLKKITLYYQPHIFTNKFENEIKLYRTEGNKNQLYVPDFLIKIEIPNKKDRYLILDSKWQKIATLKKYSLKEIIYKYCYSIESFDDSNYKNVIILQGREEEIQLFSFQNSKLSLKNKNIKNPLLEIIPFNPKNNKLNYILNIIEVDYEANV